jgi:hypothetical protein
MVVKMQLRAAMAVACMTLAMTWGPARADDIPLITGKHWTESSQQLKQAYLLGIANVIQVDVAYQAGNASMETQTVAPRFARGMKGQTLDTVREGLDSWYAAHPDRLQRPVIETIWFEMVVPGLQKSK